MSLKVTNSSSEWTPKYFWLFGALFVIAYLISNILMPKVFLYKGFAITAGIFVFPLACILGDVLTEIYGFNNTRKIIWLGLIANVVLILSTKLAMMLPVSLNPEIDTAINVLFELTPRIALASFIAYLVGEFSNSYIVSKMKIKQKGKNFGLRAIFSTFVGQFFDSFLVNAIAFYGVFENKILLMLMLSDWAIKLIYEIVALPITSKVVKTVKQKEGIEHFDKEDLTLI
jgi:hypothetical protein